MTNSIRTFPGGERWFNCPNIHTDLPNTGLLKLPMTCDGGPVVAAYRFTETTKGTADSTTPFEQTLVASGATFPSDALGCLVKVERGANFDGYGEYDLIRNVVSRTNDTTIVVDSFPEDIEVGDVLVLWREKVVCHEARIWCSGSGGACYVGIQRRPGTSPDNYGSFYIDTTLAPPIYSPDGFDQLYVQTASDMSAKQVNIIAW